MRRRGFRRLVFVDEFGTNLGMTRAHARSVRGQRACGSAPQNTDPPITLVMGVRLGQSVLAPIAFEGAMNGPLWEPYIATQLVPQLQPGDALIADGLGAHRSLVARHSVEAAGAAYLLLPP